MISPTDPALLSAISKATCEALKQAEIFLPPDVVGAIRNARDCETSEIARGELDNILANLKMAEDLSVPICQDTGVPVIYLTVPPDLPVTNDLFEAVNQGVRTATDTVPLRPNVVLPLSRENTRDNTGPRMPDIPRPSGGKNSP